MPFANISTIQLTNLLTGPLALSLNLPDGGLVAARLEAGETFTLPPTVGLDMLNRCADFHTLIDSGRAAMTLGQGVGDIAGIPASNSAVMMSTAGVSMQSGVAIADGTGLSTITFPKAMAGTDYVVSAWPEDPADQIGANPALYPIGWRTTTGMTLQNMSGGALPAHWMVIGTLA